MLKNKYCTIKKGYILVHTMIFGALIILISIYSFTLELRKAKNVVSYKNYTTTVKDYEEHREYLFTKLSDLYNTSYYGKTKDELKNIFIQSNLNIVCLDEKGILGYDKDINYIYIKSFEQGYVYRKDFYDFDIIDNKIKFSYIKSVIN